MKLKKNSFSPKLTFYLGIIAFGLMVGLSIQFGIAAWTEPTATPPGGNVSAPVNISGNRQSKSGWLGVNSNVPPANLLYALDVRDTNGPGYIGSTGGAIINWDYDSTSGLLVPYGNVGIGTLSPTQKLDVIGYVRGSTGLCIGSDCRTSWPSGGGGLAGSGTANYVSKWTAGTALGNSQIFDNGTRVGIGTTSPSRKLSVAGEIQLNGYPTGLYLGNSQGFYDNGGGGLNVRVPTSGARMTLSTNGGPIELAGGNVGIGTTSPAQKLDVNGSIKGTYMYSDIYFGNTGGFILYSPAPSDTWSIWRNLSTQKVTTPEICLSGACRTSWTAGITAANFYTKSSALSGGSASVSCNAGDVMTGGSCFGQDVCSSNDSTSYGGYPSGNGWYCPDMNCTNITAYVRCYDL